MKRIKMVLYGEPGTGKSVFASKAPTPFFVCTDGNYEWLEEFGAKAEDHVNVMTWSEAKTVFSDIASKSAYDKYETIVVDLTEDLFKWCEQEYCTRNNIEHLSDLGYGKAYDATRNEFFIEMGKLFNVDKHIILIMHGMTYTEKDRRGIEHTKYGPTSRIPDKVLDMIEGRTRYFLRCYVKDEELEDGTILKKRYLSLIPKPNEFGISRGLNEKTTPYDVPLEWSEFAKAIGLTGVDEPEQEKPKRSRKVVTDENKPVIEQLAIDIKQDEKIEHKVEDDIKDDTLSEENKPAIQVEEKAESVEQPSQDISTNDRIAAIKAKLAALNKK